MTREDIKRTILQKIDEISPYSQTDEQYDLLIEGLLDDAANKYMMLVPITSIKDNTSPVPVSSLVIGSGIWEDLGIVILPDDFQRLAFAECDHWRRPAVESDYFTTTSGEYHRQFDIHTRAGIAKPKLFFEQTGKKLIVSPFRQNWLQSEIRIFYVKRITAELMQEDLLDGFFYYAASSTLTSMRQEDFAKVLMDRCNEFLMTKQ
jgi:hypothetical protein